MRLLLDTHVFLWWLDDPAKVAEPARRAIATPANAVYVSAVVMQEIAIKRAKGRLTFPEPLLPLLAANHFIALPITLDHAEAMGTLSLIHDKPFDR